MSERDRDQIKPENDDVTDEAKVPEVQSNLAVAAPTLAPPAPDVMLDTELQAFIGRQLRATYDEVLSEPVPDRLMELLAKLEKGKAEKS